ncbi:hypothetical protein F0562_024850 [Nyssa sinensis]|uniref:Uncharacterized protein n=1 Tax=Nyssa sinensis TaxID=561372 RepID=A0A5J5BGN8_9ASTE|nr:hypothetical protein F0562_024850 [Nyssa sinensis]
MWTEACTGWYTEFGGSVPYRPVEDLAYSVPSTTEEQIVAEQVVASLPLAKIMMLQLMNMAHVFKSESGPCAAFLSNYDPESSAKVTFENVQYDLPPWSVSILPDCKNVVFNTARVGLKGEALSLHTVSGSSSVEWVEGSLLAQKQPLTWYKTTFNAPEGNDPLALHMNSMGKGLIWINGENIGRHWPGYTAHGSCSSCSYAGIYNEKKCRSNCGEASQRWYHVPQSWLNPTGNLLVVFEEWGGDPTGIALVRRTQTN